MLLIELKMLLKDAAGEKDWIEPGMISQAYAVIDQNPRASGFSKKTFVETKNCFKVPFAIYKFAPQFWNNVQDLLFDGHWAEASEHANLRN